MVFIDLAAFMTRYYWEMVFWALFEVQNRDFRTLDAYWFKIIAYHLYHSILIDHRNPLIYGFYHFGGLSDQLLLRNGILGPIWGPK